VENDSGCPLVIVADEFVGIAAVGDFLCPVDVCKVVVAPSVLQPAYGGVKIIRSIMPRYLALVLLPQVVLVRPLAPLASLRPI